jgi:hypothetical protein
LNQKYIAFPKSKNYRNTPNLLKLNKINLKQDQLLVVQKFSFIEITWWELDISAVKSVREKEIQGNAFSEALPSVPN